MGQAVLRVKHLQPLPQLPVGLNGGYGLAGLATHPIAFRLPSPLQAKRMTIQIRLATQTIAFGLHLRLRRRSLPRWRVVVLDVLQALAHLYPWKEPLK